jgi:3-oxoacyl-[acyl-carrier protein] reductase
MPIFLPSPTQLCYTTNRNPKKNTKGYFLMTDGPLPLAGKTALITGSSQGIGRATALRLAQSGANVVINYRNNKSAALEAQATIEALGRKCLAIQADVSQEEGVQQLFTQATQELGPITILVNNAGTTRDKLILQMSLADFEHVMDTNLRSAFLCTKAVLRSMMKARWGRIVNVASTAGLLGSAGQANYAASKAAILGLTLSTAREMASRNVTVNAITPGFVSTELTSTVTEQQRAYILENTPLGRAGTTDEVAAAIHFLCQPEAGYITGQILSVDGGLSIHI